MLRKLVAEAGRDVNWDLIKAQIGHGLNKRQCKERYNNYLRPGLRQGNWSASEDMLLLKKFSELGPHWSKMVSFFIGRSETSIKNRYSTLMYQSKRKVIRDESDVPDAVYPQIDEILSILPLEVLEQAKDPFSDLKALIDASYFDDEINEIISNI